MLQKETQTLNSDTSNFKKLKIFHIYRSGCNKIGSPGFFTFSSIKERIIIEDEKKKAKKKKKKVRSCIIRARKLSKTHDHQFLKSIDNASTLFIKRTPRNIPRIHGPAFYSVKRSRY